MEEICDKKRWVAIVNSPHLLKMFPLFYQIHLQQHLQQIPGIYNTLYLVHKRKK